MIETAYVLASLSVMLLIGAFVAWFSLRSRSQFALASGHAEANAGHSQVAASLLLAGVCLSALAATLTIAWFAF